jgi:predicted DNA-binding transcriptional regulator AlpA
MDTTNTPIDAQRLAVPAKSAAAICGVSRAQWWKLFSAGKVPAPVYLGAKAPRWRVDELRDWLAAGAPDLLTWQRLRGAQR